ncbi:hypothetical protein SAY87_015071 [Trapa incisa]|uniref:Ubiquitin-like domain-containing protein n=1 Tax=Trapa incisa TaxID=236973 RepID=A0AAN7GYH3_9MYRT|nr:hypothetical protein SAY87_015071 [Trapa incisa]
MDLHVRGNYVRPFQVFVRLLTGNTKTLLFHTLFVSGLAIKERIFEFTNLPISEQCLVYSGRQIGDASLLQSSDSTVHLCLRLRGGKGGFGSLLRGAATKAGQKKTNNFDACRDMSGRRLRHVNAEKKLEEWRAKEEERKLEKIAENFIKKTSKTGKKGVHDGEAHKYVQKYREESAKCVAQVELSVREAVGSSATFRRGFKRKAGLDTALDGKKLKIWMGKRKVADSDSDDTDEDISMDEKENAKSVILDNSSGSDAVKGGQGNSDSSTVEEPEFITAVSSIENGTEKMVIAQEISVSSRCPPEESLAKKDSTMVEPIILVCKDGQGSLSPSTGTTAIPEDELDQAEKKRIDKFELGSEWLVPSQTVVDLPIFGEGNVSEVEVPNDVNGSTLETKVVVMDETVSLEADKVEEDQWSLEEYNSTTDLEVLGLERLKRELQMRGLKCGGTLQERASRLYLLKSTPLNKMPRKFLAKN